MKNRTPFKLRSGNKPSIAKIAGVEKETPMKRNIFKDINTKLQNLGKKAQEFKAKRKAAKDRKFSEDKIDVKRNIKDQVARTRRGESKFQERARIRRESRLTDAKKKEIRDLTAKAKAEQKAKTKGPGLSEAKKAEIRKLTKEARDKKAADKTATTKTTFKGAFADARKAGKKEFTYKGKKYTTKLKSETSSKKATAKKTKTKKATPKYDRSKDPIVRNIKRKEDPIGSRIRERIGI